MPACSATIQPGNSVRLVREDGSVIILTQLEASAVAGVTSPAAAASRSVVEHLAAHRSMPASAEA